MDVKRCNPNDDIHIGGDGNGGASVAVRGVATRPRTHVPLVYELTTARRSTRITSGRRAEYFNIQRISLANCYISILILIFASNFLD